MASTAAMSTEQEFVTAEEIAGYLRVSPKTVNSWAREKRIPSVKLTPKSIRFRLPEVKEALGLPAS